MKNCTTKKTKYEKIGRQAVVCLFWLVIWQIGAMLVNNPLLLPSPWQTAEALLGLAGETKFYLNISWTMLRCLSAMALSFVIGAAAAFGAYKSAWLRRVLTLPVGFFKAVPVMAIIIYVILLAKADIVAIIVCFLMCFPVVYTNILEGLDSMPAELLELAKVYWFTEWQTMKYMYIPSIEPQIKASVRLIAGLSWKAVVAAEVLSIPKFSLGYEMLSAKYYLETPQLFAYILVIVVLSLTVEKIINICLSHTGQKDYRGSKLFSECKAGDMKAKNSKSDIRTGGVDASFEHTNQTSQKPPTVSFCSVCKKYGDKSVLDDFTFDFKEGRITALMGPSGQGKTTVARILAMVENMDSGHIEYSGSHKLSYLFQEDRLVPWLNVYDNLALGLVRENKSPNCDMIFDMAKSLEIEDVLWQLPAALSGGMSHRVAIGRTFLADSNLMILDEPFRGLDETLKKRIIERLWKKETEGKTVILITHNSEDADRLADVKASLS